MVFTLEVLHAEINNPVVKVLTAQVCVSSCGLHLENAVLNSQQRYIESTATHVIDKHIFLPASFLVQAIGDGCCSWLVDDTQHIQAADLACIFGGLALGVVEICRNGHNGIVDLGPQICLCCLLHLDENHGRDLLRVELLLLTSGIHHNHGLVTTARLDLEGPQLDIRLHVSVRKLATDETLCIKNSVLRVACNLILGCIANETFAVCE